ncbi:MAG: hypothetical protein QF464_03115, partial [Myxococcota bacterium]|nr:hypothetical protein [Myxococcota bacterium]
TRLPADLPPGVRAVIETALAKTADARFPTAAAMREALAASADERARGAAAPAPPVAATPEPPTPTPIVTPTPDAAPSSPPSGSREAIGRDPKESHQPTPRARTPEPATSDHDVTVEKKSSWPVLGISGLVGAGLLAFYVSSGSKPDAPDANTTTVQSAVAVPDKAEAPAPEEMKKLFSAFEKALEVAAATVCKCEDMNCAESMMMTLRGIRPPGRPSPDQMQVLQPHMKKIQECMQRLRSE